MVALYPEAHGPLANAHRFGSDVGGAEFNVATSLARMGIPTAWISRLGADGLGERVSRVANESGVDVSAVDVDPERPTGLYIKETLDGGAGTQMHYYRSNSAASAITRDLLTSPAAAAVLHQSSIVHTSGITAALSATCADAVSGLRELVGPRALVSVDLNFRPALWRGRTTEALDALIGQADILFAGRDEALLHAGHDEPDQIFAAHPHLDRIVLKDADRSASVHRRDGSVTEVACLTVEVVEPVGAGDAFAAGFLAAHAEGRDETACLRVGHAVASLALSAPGDRPITVPTLVERNTIAAATTNTWGTWRVSPGANPWRETAHDAAEA